MTSSSWTQINYSHIGYIVNVDSGTSETVRGLIRRPALTELRIGRRESEEA